MGEMLDFPIYGNFDHGKNGWFTTISGRSTRSCKYTGDGKWSMCRTEGREWIIMGDWPCSLGMGFKTLFKASKKKKYIWDINYIKHIQWIKKYIFSIPALLQCFCLFQILCFFEISRSFGRFRGPPVLGDSGASKLSFIRPWMEQTGKT